MQPQQLCRSVIRQSVYAEVYMARRGADMAVMSGMLMQASFSDCVWLYDVRRTTDSLPLILGATCRWKTAPVMGLTREPQH